MDPFQDTEWLLAAELAALLGEAARWDWSESHQEAALLSRELADAAYAGRNLRERPELVEDLGKVIAILPIDSFLNTLARKPTTTLSSENGLTRLHNWRKQAESIFARLHGIVYPGSRPDTESPSSRFD